MIKVMNIFSKFFAIVGAGVVFATPVLAVEPFLTVINSMTGEQVSLDREGFMALDGTIVKTENEWADGMTSYEGPLARSVIALVDYTGITSATLTAVDGYSVEVPIDDFMAYDVIFAHSANGSLLSRRDKGPLWTIYPASDNPVLQAPLYNQRQVWALHHVELK